MHFLIFNSLFSVFVGSDITNDIEMLTNSSGRTSIFYEGHKYLKSGESRQSLQFRCCNYLKKCKSRIILNLKSRKASKNEVGHNHDVDPNAYQQALKSTVDIHRFEKL